MSESTPEPTRTHTAYREGMVGMVHKEDIARVKEQALKNLGGLVFRRVTKVAIPRQAKFTYVLHSPSGETRIAEGDVAKLSPEHMRNRLEVRISNYTAYTSLKNEPRTPKTHRHKTIAIPRKNKCEFDPMLLALRKSPHACDPIADLTDTRSLVCGLVEEQDGRLVFSKWMVCSFQFLNFWLLLTEGIDSFRVKLSKTNPSYITGRDLTRQHIMGGGKLATNTFLRTMMAYEAHGKLAEFKAKEELIFSMPWGEIMTRYHVHIYNFLALVLFYRELPCATNVPTTTLDGMPNNPPPWYLEPLPVPFWDLPVAYANDRVSYPAFADAFLTKWKIRKVPAKHLKIPTPANFISPKQGSRKHPTPVVDRPPPNRGMFALDPSEPPTKVTPVSTAAEEERAPTTEAPTVPLGDLEVFPELPKPRGRKMSSVPAEGRSTGGLSASTEIMVTLLSVTKSRSPSRSRSSSRARTPLSESDLEHESDESTSSRPPSRPLTPVVTEPLKTGSNWFQVVEDQEEMDFSAPVVFGERIVLPAYL